MRLVFGYPAARKGLSGFLKSLQAPVKGCRPNSVLYLPEMCPPLSHFPPEDPLPA